MNEVSDTTILTACRGTCSSAYDFGSFSPMILSVPIMLIIIMKISNRYAISAESAILQPRISFLSFIGDHLHFIYPMLLQNVENVNKILIHSIVIRQNTIFMIRL